MAIGTEIKYAAMDDLYLDPTNPRLGRNHVSPNLKQADILDLMKDWSLEELAVSFLESGFWPHEAMLVIHEKLYGKNQMVVVEGNRRLAALRMLALAKSGQSKSSRWEGIIDGRNIPNKLFERIPYIEVDSRDDVAAFLGFRHVTGIKEWKPAEKAEYVAYLIEKQHMSYEEARRKIGSKTPTVRRNYIAYRLLLQMEDEEENVDIGKVEEKFSVLFLSLKTSGVQKYLQIDMEADPKRALRPVPKSHLKNLANFALWLFGEEKTPPLFSDSRYVDRFSAILESNDAIKYLERADKPSFDTALRIAGGDEPELLKSIQRASENIQLALTNAHQYRKSAKVRLAVERFGTDALQLLAVFPDIRAKVLAEAESAKATN